MKCKEKSGWSWGSIGGVPKGAANGRQAENLGKEKEAGGQPEESSPQPLGDAEEDGDRRFVARLDEYDMEE